MNYVMIIDDSKPDQFLSKFIVEQHNSSAEISQAYDGLEALEILDQSKKQPDVIFLDINMPRMNGHEFLEEYSKRSVCGNVVVMLSSLNQSGDKEKTSAYSCVKAHLIKPLNKTSMDEIDKLLNDIK